MHISVVDAVGWFAGALVFLTFFPKTMIPLRMVAIAGSAVFIVYGWVAGNTPVLALNACLLPLNALRLWQIRSLVRKVKGAARGSLETELLMPYLSLRRVPAGSTLWKKGDVADEMMLILKGSARIVEFGIARGPGDLLGEMGLFAPDSRRTATAVCETDLDVASITDAKLWELICQEPEFGVSLLRIVIFRSTTPDSPAAVMA
jgi:CRP/FNR family cyclic AMP-dependent transcriptional regulator